MKGHINIMSILESFYNHSSHINYKTAKELTNNITHLIYFFRNHLKFVSITLKNSYSITKFTNKK